MTVHGNHEDMATGYFALFALPGIEEIYSFDWGDVHFVVLNDSPTAGRLRSHRPPGAVPRRRPHRGPGAPGAAGVDRHRAITARCSAAIRPRGAT